MSYQSPRHSVSVKGVVVRDGCVLLLRNERSEWELPGGKLEVGEEPARCAEREIAEESGWAVVAGPLLDAWQYPVAGEHVLILTYGCYAGHELGEPVVSMEHTESGLFTAAQVGDLEMPDGYKRSIADWYRRLAECG